MSATDLIELVHRLGAPRILVLGDLVLDRYVWGHAERISQEAPVVMLRADTREHRPGGAASVGMMLAALGARVSLAGVVGNDPDGETIRGELDRRAIDGRGVVSDPGRPTTVKERYIGRAQDRHPQQMLRVDYEVRDRLSAAIEARLGPVLDAAIAESDIVLISDYDKGVCTPSLLTRTFAAARGRGIRAIADPVRGPDYRRYRGAHCLTPNRLEAQLATGGRIGESRDALGLAGRLVEQCGLEAAIVTLDRDGMALRTADGRGGLFPTRPRQVYDITGAGDMVLSVIGMALAAGASYEQAIRLANVAGGLEVEKIGVATLSRGEILRDLLVSHASERGKLRARDELARELDHRRSLGETIVFTNGCFDLLHVGHIRCLHQARAQGDLLVVGLNSDRSVRALKGPERPFNPQERRAEVLAALEAVDYLVIFDEPTPQALIESVRPDVLVKAADYAPDEVVGRHFVESYGGRLWMADLVPDVSTTHLLGRLRPRKTPGVGEGLA